MLQKQPFLPYFKQRGFVFKYKLIAVHQRYEATTISIRKILFKCTLVQNLEPNQMMGRDISAQVIVEPNCQNELNSSQTEPGK